MNWRNLPAGVKRNRRAYAELAALGFRPDVCVADYEPVTWRLARRYRAPVVTVDHQHTYLGFALPRLANGLSPQEERSRLALFFPTAASRIAISFFKVDAPPDERYRVRLMPPIIRPDVAELAWTARAVQDDFILIYLSAYPQIGSFVDHAALADIFAARPEWRFKIYSRDFTSSGQAAPNVELAPALDGDFLQDLARAAGLICTAGFTLLSEAMLLNLPVLAIPLATYDQHLCAGVIGKAGVGMAVGSERAVTAGVVGEFLARLAEFRCAISRSDVILRASPEAVLDDICAAIVSAALAGPAISGEQARIHALLRD